MHRAPSLALMLAALALPLAASAVMDKQPPPTEDAPDDEPDITTPGPDLANYPNSAFTLPQGRAYIEMTPFNYSGGSKGGPAQYNAGFLLRYGLFDRIELRLLGDGVTWAGGSKPTWGFSPLAFDTKIHFWDEQRDYFLPALGFEAVLQTQLLGSAEFNGGTQPSFSFNLDQTLPFDIAFEYNFGGSSVRDEQGRDTWQFNFSWGLQRNLFADNFAVFIHGYHNAMNLKGVPALRIPGSNVTENAIGAGFQWTVTSRLAVFGQASGGTTSDTPSVIGMMGFAAAF